MPTPTTALLIVRVWSEPNAVPPHRFSVSWTEDVTLGLTDERNFSDAGAAAELVRAWLDGLG
jgi:hypothetical protein